MSDALTSKKFYSFPIGPANEGGDRLKVVIGEFTTPAGNFDADSDGYESLDLSEYLDSVLLCLIEPSGGYVFEYDYSNKGVVARFADYDKGSDGALISAGSNAVDIDLTLRFIAVGY